ncbi:MAG: Spermine synthase [Bacteroidetes bacterium]|nr:Spermine synthase [Bacteroidota bacterium]
MKPSSSASMNSPRTRRTSPKGRPLANRHSPPLERPLALSVLALGWTTIVTQTVLLRSFLSVFYGNELVIGVVLASWLVLTGAGAALGKYAGAVSHRLLILLQVALALLPIVTVMALSFLKSLVFPPGTMIGLWESMYGSLLLLAPFCLISGFLFPIYAAALAGDAGPGRISRVYGVEAAGSVIGGILFTLVAVRFLSTMQILSILGVINLAVAGLLAWNSNHRSLSLLPDALALVLVFLPGAVDLDALFRQWLFAGQELVEYKDTPYGSITVTRKGEQLNFFENSGLLFSTGDAASNEEAVHFAMVQRPEAGRVLLISGGLSGMIEEILKYPAVQVDYVEMNPWLIEMGRRHVSAGGDPRVQVFAADARQYVRRAGRQYDVVLINVPDPGTAQINRYYTQEFFDELKSALSDNAVVSLSVLPTTEYLGHEGRQVSSIIHATLASGFANVLVLPGMRNHFLASDGPLRGDIARMVDSLGLKTTYVNPFYVDDRSTQERSRRITVGLDRDAAINHDFTPVAYYRQVQYWLSYFSFQPWIPAAVCLLLLGILATKMKVVSYCMFIGGAAGSSLEVVLLLAFQIMFGSLYLATGMIITAFMAGLAAGSFVRWRLLSGKPEMMFAWVQAGVGVYALLLPVILSILKRSAPGDILTYSIFLVLTAGIGGLIGMEFFLATRLLAETPSAVAGNLYSTDLLGSAVGALAVSAFLLPLLGITWVCVIVGCMSMGGAALMLFLALSSRNVSIRDLSRASDGS